MVDDRKQGGEEVHPQALNKPKSALAAREEEVQKFWEREGIFEKSLQKPAPKGEFVFYDGPPFANGLPHYGHILAGTIKDAIPRYRTMAGYRVRRQWGWDCHGLPVENLVEKELGFKSKRDIEEYGVEKFNEAARVSIMKDVADWKRIIPRLGRWADMEQDYKTMDTTYTESVWWAFRRLYDQGLVYEGFKAMHLCPRCGTTLSNFEVAQGYKDIDDLAVTVKLTLVDELDTSLLIWTTTPWTLPGNAAAAVNPEFTYEKVQLTDGSYVVAAKGKVEGKVVKTFLGTELVGKQYLPPFEYFVTELHKHKTHAWKVYAADFVTMEDGTGIVHIAPAFGSDDLELAQKNKIPLIHHVTEEGKFTTAVSDFAGLSVKPKGNPRETDEKVAKLLQERGLLFKQEKIRHAYPHCWRCDTPLLNWAANSWFVSVSNFKDKILAQNSTIKWMPGHVGEGRFGKWLEGARDWAVSRSRYWGAPLPVWRNQKTKEVRVAGSIDDLLSMVQGSGNRYFVMRHGEAINNTKDLFDSSGSPHNHLTQKGEADVRASAQKLRAEHIDLVVVSPLLRTQQTAKILRQELGLPESALLTDERIREMQVGIYDGKPVSEWERHFVEPKEQCHIAPPGGESFDDIRRRMGEFLFDMETRHKGKTILIVTHDCPAWQLWGVATHRSCGEIFYGPDTPTYLRTGEYKELPFTPFPHNANYELDLHRPYIDEVDTGEWKRVGGVFDCWFESGSMPYASTHYPFSKEKVDPQGIFGFGRKGYPADFIAEGLDQTRGWFYSLLVLGTALFGKTPYENVIVNGLVLAADGQKMSKRLNNYPDPLDLVEKYGADALRFYLLSSSVVRGEDLRFNERGVDEVAKKIIMRLENVLSFYEMYAHDAAPPGQSSHVLDRWILSRLHQCVQQTTDGFEGYELDVATRPLGEFVDDLSTWYLRRSRERFKAEGEDQGAAVATLQHVLTTVAHVMAPTMPFFADHIYRRLCGGESVHLQAWPIAGAVDEALLLGMQQTRALASAGLELRERAGIKVRQPLSRLTIKQDLPEELRAILADELNVKEIVLDTNLHEEAVLDTELTPELKEEGALRDWVRTIQEWRKEEGLSVGDRPGLLVHTPEVEFVRHHREALMQATGLLSLETKEGELKLERL